MSETKFTYAFFGTGALAESVLAALVAQGYMPSLVVTKPDSAQGRHMVLTEPYIKTWAKLKGVPVYQPESLKTLDEHSPLHAQHFDVFIVASYGKILPEAVLTAPTHGVLNVHPSLLPAYRGPSPIESSLLDGNMTTGVTIIKLDEEMDHGPILAQNAFVVPLQSTAGTLEVLTGQMGGQMLAEVLPHYLEGTLILKEQDHERAIFCKKISKDLGEITLQDTPDEVLRKYRALTPWPGLYFFITHHDKRIRVKVNQLDLLKTEASQDVASYIISVTPEGKKPMDFESFKRGYLS